MSPARARKARDDAAAVEAAEARLADARQQYAHADPNKPDAVVAAHTARILAEQALEYTQRQRAEAEQALEQAEAADRDKRIARAQRAADRAALFELVDEHLVTLGRANATLAARDTADPHDLGIAFEAGIASERAVAAALADQHAACATLAELGGPTARPVAMADLLSAAHVEQLAVAAELALEALFAIRFVGSDGRTPRTDDRPDRGRILGAGVDPVAVARLACRLGSWADAVRAFVPETAAERANRVGDGSAGLPMFRRITGTTRGDWVS